jgi:hypothetical protein
VFIALVEKIMAKIITLVAKIGPQNNSTIQQPDVENLH